jgi:adenosylcobinamide-GDP ribazoletransferase
VLVATALLTRVPVPIVADAGDVGRAARWFPLVGAGIGAASALMAWTMTELMQFPASVAAMLIVGLAAWVTGALHLDGLADTVDGFGGGRDSNTALRIMRDPSIGSYGATALVLVIGLKVTAIATLLARGEALAFVVAAPALSRWTIPALAVSLPYARVEGGVGRAVTQECGITGLVGATAVAAGIALATLGVDGLMAWALVALTAVCIARQARRRIGGVTGDVFGASVELAEASVLLCGVWRSGGA